EGLLAHRLFEIDKRRKRPDERAAGIPAAGIPAESLRQRLAIPALRLSQDEPLRREEVLGILEVGQRQAVDDFLNVLQHDAHAERVARLVELQPRDGSEILAAVGPLVTQLHLPERDRIGERRSKPFAKLAGPVADYSDRLAPAGDLQDGVKLADRL